MSKFEHETQCELSYELLYLLKWLVEHEAPALKKLVQKAVAQGIKHQQITDDALLSPHMDAQVQYSIVELLDMLDEFLEQALEKENMKQADMQNLTPAIHKIDATVYDSGNIRVSIDKATEHIRQHPEKMHVMYCSRNCSKTGNLASRRSHINKS